MKNDNPSANVINYNDRLAYELVCHLKNCGIEVGNMEILVSEFGCNFQASIENPDTVTECKIQASSSFSNAEIDKIRNAFEKLRQDIEKIITEGRDAYFKEAEVSQNLKTKFQERFQCLSMELNEYIVCLPVYKTDIQSEERQNFLFLIVQMQENEAARYREIINYLLSLVSAELEKIDAIPGFLQSKFFAFQMPDKRTFAGNYVDWFLKSRNLPGAEVLIELSAEKYEGSESEARIYIDSADVTTIGVLDKMGVESRRIRSENRRMIRKMMEISKKGTIYLLAEKSNDGKDLLITKLVKKKDKTGTETGLYIKFFGYLCWGIVCEGTERIIYEKGQYIINSSQNEKEYCLKIKALRKKIAAGTIPPELDAWFTSGKLEKLVEVLRGQKHGTAVILTNCDDEAKRLCAMNRGTLIDQDAGICTDNDVWNAEQLLSVTSIDGAIFMGLDGMCKAIGVIVDGTAVVKGDTGKGARYNSIINYVGQKKPDRIFLDIIISEDGIIELTCNL